MCDGCACLSFSTSFLCSSSFHPSIFAVILSSEDPAALQTFFPPRVDSFELSCVWQSASKQWTLQSWIILTLHFCNKVYQTVYQMTMWKQCDNEKGYSSKFWTLYVGVLYGLLPKSTAIPSNIFYSSSHMRALSVWCVSLPSLTPLVKGVTRSDEESYHPSLQLPSSF